LIFSIINHKPTAINLIAPPNSSTMYLPHGPIEFLWNSSLDLDAEDSIFYSINVKGPGLDTTLSGISDTTINFDIAPQLQMHQYYSWTVSATDGYDIVASPDTFSFFTDFGEGVKDIGLGIPKEFALHQNYPNPFNPSTTIRFDLPVQSIVTITVYNLLGNEVNLLISGQRLEPGVKEIQVNSSNLASGIYFYRILVINENGKDFSNVKRMVLLK